MTLIDYKHSRKSSEISENITIRYLNIFQNEFYNISQIHVDQSVKLQIVDISRNRLRSMNIGPDFVQDLTTLKLNKNQLWELSPGFLNRMVKLKALYLENNALRLYPSMFKSMSDLRVLSMTKNYLKVVDLSWFEGLQNLTQLNLEDNLLSNINYTAIMGVLPSLQSLLIDKNEFRCSFVETMVNYVRNTTEGRSIEFSSGGRGKYPTCIADDQPGESYWGWIFTGFVLSVAFALMIVMRRQLFERFVEARRRLRSYRNMRETEHGESGSGPLAEEGDD